MGTKLIQCSNGHYYDAEQYKSCPYCQSVKGKSFSDIDRVTDSFISKDDSRTMPMEHISDSTRGMQTGVQTTAVQNQSANLGGSYQDAYNEGKTVPYFGDFTGTDISSDANSIVKTRNPQPVVGWLVCIEGTNYGHSFYLYAGKNFIGRASDMDICLKGDGSVSRTKHAIITYEPKERKFFAQPGESHELFYVNDNVVLTSVELKDRDEISVGKTKLVFVPFCNSKYGWEK